MLNNRHDSDTVNKEPKKEKTKEELAEIRK